MGIRDIPSSYEAFEAWSREYERREFRYADTNQRVGTSTRRIFESWGPRIAAPAVRYGIYAMLDDEMLAAFGFPRPLPGTRALLRGALGLRGRVLRWFPPRTEPHFFTDDRNRTHPDGYEIGKLGPRKLVEAEERRRHPPVVG
jgi:hypothetical protein